MDGVSARRAPGCLTWQPCLMWQFFITTVATPFLDGKHVIFGEVDSGFQTLGALEENGSASGAPAKQAVIVDCGEL